MAIIEPLNSYAAAASRTYRNLRRTLVSGATSLTGMTAYVPQHLDIALQDLRSADIAMVREFYGGRFLLSGKLIDTGGESPFEIPVEHSGWQHSLHSFAWLRHFSASDDPVAGKHAQALLRDWIDLNGGYAREQAWGTGLTARRMISWLNHSIVILSSADHEFHDLFMRALGAHARHLKRYAASAQNEFSILLAYIALTYAFVCFSGRSAALGFAMRKLDQELASQVVADGSHISRNPQSVVELLALLLPLREACISAGKEMPNELIPAIERLLQALRFLRMGDGHLCRFNGVGASEVELLSAIQRHDETMPRKQISGELGGYSRLHAQDTILIMDTEAPPRGELSRQSHAGCLSFELSIGNELLIVNVGKHPGPPPGTPSVWRTTAAHSTAVFSDTSSSKFENTGSIENPLSGQLFGNALNVGSERADDTNGEKITAWHFGYVREFGARHERSLQLSTDGKRLVGQDWFSASDKGDLYYTTKDAVTLHFHLHPSVEVEVAEKDGPVTLKTLGGQTWQFTCSDASPEVEESIFFAGITGAKPSRQIALKVAACKTPVINWSLERKG